MGGGSGFAAGQRGVVGTASVSTADELGLEKLTLTSPWSNVSPSLSNFIEHWCGFERFNIIEHILMSEFCLMDDFRHTQNVPPTVHSLA